ncbi:MAG: cyclic peptide export ABC transporter [Cyanobacteria bacterium P01_H01_bin.35]
MNIIWLLIKASWVSSVIAILAGFISGGCSAGLITLINTAIKQNSAQSIILPFIGLTILGLISGILSRFVLIDLAQNSVYQLRLRLSQQILAAPLQKLEAIGPNQLLAVLTNDVQAISQVISAIPGISMSLAIVGGCLIYLGWLSGWVFLAVVVFLTVIIALVQTLINYSNRYFYLSRQEIDQLYQHFRGITEGIKQLKLHSQRRQIFFEEDLSTTAKASQQYQKMAKKVAAVSNLAAQTLFFIMIGLLLFYLPQTGLDSQSILPAYIFTLTYLMAPLAVLLGELPVLANANVSINKINAMKLTLIEQAEINSPVRQCPQQSWQILEFDRVVHTYHNKDNDHAFTVGPINLTLKAGELVFIVGGNGSGKSTLAKLLAGLYFPDSGQLILDNQPIIETNREWYRQHFSVIFSDFYLFERLISTEDLTLDNQVQKYLKKLELDHKVLVKDGKLSTTALSQGQRKRLALLSAYLEDRPIYLFDEWAADQDPIFREIFYTQLLQELKQQSKTIFVISHDDHYFHLADRIIKLDYGQIEADYYPI